MFGMQSCSEEKGFSDAVAEVVGALLSPRVSQSIRTEAACVLNRIEQDVGQKRKTCTPKSSKARPRSCAHAWDGGRGCVVQGAPRSGAEVGSWGRKSGSVWERVGVRSGSERAHYMSERESSSGRDPQCVAINRETEQSCATVLRSNIREEGGTRGVVGNAGGMRDGVGKRMRRTQQHQLKDSRKSASQKEEGEADRKTGVCSRRDTWARSRV